MFYKIGKELFKILINFLQFLRVALIFLAFATVLYWFMQLAGATFFDFVTLIFESIKNFMHLFYTRTVTIDEATIDFSFLLAAFIMIAISWFLKFAVESLEFAENKFDAFHSTMKQKAEEIFNAGLEHHYLAEEYKNDNFLIIIKILATNLAKDSHFNKDVSVGVEDKQNEVLKQISEFLSSNTKCQARIFEDNLLVSFKPFEGIDFLLLGIENVLRDLASKNKQERWKIESIIGVEPYSQESEVSAKVLHLKTLLRLGLKGEVACLSTFQQRYNLLKNPKYRVIGKGIYKINDKEETVFCVERISST